MLTVTNQSNATSVQQTTVSQNETCRDFLTLVSKNYPQLKSLKFRRSPYRRKDGTRVKTFVFYACYFRRKLYVNCMTPEYAMARFMLEILRKVFMEKPMTKEEYYASKAFMKKRSILNYSVFELPNVKNALS